VLRLWVQRRVRGLARIMNTHEDLSRRDEVIGPSDRSFGLVFTAIFGILGLLPLWHGRTPRVWALILAGILLLVSILRPSVLHVANRLWMRFGLLLSRVVNPVVMGLLFYVVVTPIGLIRRMSGSDPLKLRFDSQTPSYWLARKPPGPAPDTMARQF
jgi:hypothetical protein